MIRSASHRPKNRDWTHIRQLHLQQQSILPNSSAIYSTHADICPDVITTNYKCQTRVSVAVKCAQLIPSRMRCFLQTVTAASASISGRETAVDFCGGQTKAAVAHVLLHPCILQLIPEDNCVILKTTLQAT